MATTKNNPSYYDQIKNNGQNAMSSLEVQTNGNPNYRYRTTTTPSETGSNFVPEKVERYTEPSQLAKQYGLTYDLGKIQGIFNDATEKKFNALDQEYGNTENQFYRTQYDTTSELQDAIRKANAQAVATGASKGIQAADMLSAVIEAQQQSTEAATKLAQDRNALKLQREQELADNYKSALETANAASQVLMNANATFDANDAQRAIGEENYYAQMEANHVAALSALANAYASMYGSDRGLEGTEINAEANKAVADITGKWNYDSADISGIHNERAADITGQHNERTADITGKWNYDSADITGIHNERAADITGTHNERAADITGNWNYKSADITGQHNERTAEITGQSNERVAETQADATKYSANAQTNSQEATDYRGIINKYTNAETGAIDKTSVMVNFRSQFGDSAKNVIREFKDEQCPWDGNDSGDSKNSDAASKRDAWTRIFANDINEDFAKWCNKVGIVYGNLPASIKTQLDNLGSDGGNDSRSEKILDTAAKYIYANGGITAMGLTNPTDQLEFILDVALHEGIIPRDDAYTVESSKFAFNNDGSKTVRLRGDSRSLYERHQAGESLDDWERPVVVTEVNATPKSNLTENQKKTFEGRSHSPQNKSSQTDNVKKTFEGRS